MISKARYPKNSRGMQSLDMALNSPLSPCYGNEDMNENIEDMPIAMAYVPWQQWKELYDPKDGFKRGTIFRELDLPFYGGRGTESCQ